MASIESYQMLLAAAAACEDKKAEDVRILALDPAESGLADYFLICNGTNDRQNVAITDEIELRLKREFNTLPNSVEGRRQGEWVLMDYVDFIVHVFLPEKRAYYGLERLRKSATSVSVDELSAELKSAIAETRKRKTPAKTHAPKASSRVTAPTEGSLPVTERKAAGGSSKSPSRSKRAAGSAGIKRTIRRSGGRSKPQRKS